MADANIHTASSAEPHIGERDPTVLASRSRRPVRRILLRRGRRRRGDEAPHPLPSAAAEHGQILAVFHDEPPRRLRARPPPAHVQRSRSPRDRDAAPHEGACPAVPAARRGMWLVGGHHDQAAVVVVGGPVGGPRARCRRCSPPRKPRSTQQSKARPAVVCGCTGPARGWCPGLTPEISRRWPRPCSSSSVAASIRSSEAPVSTTTPSLAGGSGAGVDCAAWKAKTNRPPVQTSASSRISPRILTSARPVWPSPCAGPPPPPPAPRRAGRAPPPAGRSTRTAAPA